MQTYTQRYAGIHRYICTHRHMTEKIVKETLRVKGTIGIIRSRSRLSLSDEFERIVRRLVISKVTLVLPIWLKNIKPIAVHFLFHLQPST
jgi:hypothetical protein